MALIGLMVVGLGFKTYLRPVYQGQMLPVEGRRAGELTDRIDPNTATMAELAEIPELGRKRAEEIVAFREAFLAGHSGEVAFKRVEDLRAIKGIGPAMVERLRGYLVFEGEGGK